MDPANVMPMEEAASRMAHVSTPPDRIRHRVLGSVRFAISWSDASKTEQKAFTLLSSSLMAHDAGADMSFAESLTVAQICFVASLVTCEAISSIVLVCEARSLWLDEYFCIPIQNFKLFYIISLSDQYKSFRHFCIPRLGGRRRAFLPSVAPSSRREQLQQHDKSRPHLYLPTIQYSKHY